MKTHFLAFLTVSQFFVIISCGHNDFGKIDIARNHPSRLIHNLIGSCRKNEHACKMSIDATADFVLNIGHLITGYDAQYDHELIETIEILAKRLNHSKDAIDLIEFEKTYGKKLETVIQKAGSILSNIPEVEKIALERSFLQPPPIY